MLEHGLVGRRLHIPQPWRMTQVRVYIQRVVNEAVSFQFFMSFFAPSFGTSCLWCFLHNTFTLVTPSLLIPSFSSLLFSSFFLPPVYNWILFSGRYKYLCLLCLCLAPHFLPLLHRHPSALIVHIALPIFLSLCKATSFVLLLFGPHHVLFLQNLPSPFSIPFYCDSQIWWTRKASCRIMSGEVFCSKLHRTDVNSSLVT